MSQPTMDEAEIRAEIERIASFLKVRLAGIRPIDVKRRVKGIMHDLVNYRRNAEGLRKALHALSTLHTDSVPMMHVTDRHARYNYELEEAIEACAMVQLATLVTISALAREESRGHHWRSDFPAMRCEWEKHTILRRTGESCQVTDAPIVRLKNRSQERRTADPSLLDAGVLQGYVAG